MSTCIRMKCDGCDVIVETAPIRKEFVSFSGRSYGLGRWHEPDIDKAVEPTGWLWSDPYTSCTYCPGCWDAIDKKAQPA